MANYRSFTVVSRPLVTFRFSALKAQQPREKMVASAGPASPLPRRPGVDSWSETRQPVISISDICRTTLVGELGRQRSRAQAESSLLPQRKPRILSRGDQEHTGKLCLPGWQ